MGKSNGNYIDLADEFENLLTQIRKDMMKMYIIVIKIIRKVLMKKMTIILLVKNVNTSFTNHWYCMIHIFSQ